MMFIVIAPGIHVEVPHVVAVRRVHATAAGGGDGRELGAEPRPSFVHRHGSDSVPAAAGDELRAQARSAAAEAQHKVEEQRRPGRRRHCVRARAELRATATTTSLQLGVCEGRLAGQQEHVLVAIRQDTTGDDVIYSGRMAGCVFSSSRGRPNGHGPVAGPRVVVVDGSAYPVFLSSAGTSIERRS